MKEQKHSQYFEGILQLRNPSKELLHYVNETEDYSPVPRIPDIKNVKNGYDVYFIDKKVLQQFGKKLQEKFGAEMKVSAKLFTRDKVTSKEVYRINVLIRQPFFKEGDIIEIKGDLYKVTQLGKKVSAMNVNSGKRLTFRYKDLPE